MSLAHLSITHNIFPSGRFAFNIHQDQFGIGGSPYFQILLHGNIEYTSQANEPS